MSKLDDARLSCITETDVVIAVVGGSGTGKTTFINRATGELPGSVFHVLDSDQKGLEVVKFTHPRFRRSIIFLDTPGLNDLSAPGKRPWMLIHSWLQRQYQGTVKLSGIIFLQRITDNRLDSSSLAALPMLLTLCEEGSASVYLVTTMWSDFRDRVERYKERELRDVHWRWILERGAHAVRFDDTFEGSWQISNKILKRARDRSIDLRAELLQLRQSLSTLKGGLKLFHALQTLLVDRHEIAGLMREAFEQDDIISCRELQTQLARVDLKLAKTYTTIRNMKAPLGGLVEALCPRGDYLKSSYSA